MSIVVVQNDGNYSAAGAASLSVNLAALPTVGNALLIGIALFQNTGGSDVTSVTDNQTGNTYVKIAESAETSGEVAMIYACESIASASGTFTLTVNTNSANDYMTVGVAEISGLAAAPVDVTDTVTSAVNTTTPSIGPTAATAQADEIAFGVLCCIGANPTNLSSPAGYTNVYVQQNTTYQVASIDYEILSATGTLNPTWTAGSGTQNGWSIALATFKAASGSTLFNLGAADGIAPSTGSASLSQSLPSAVRMRALTFGSASLSQQLPSQASARASAYGASSLRQQMPLSGAAKAPARASVSWSQRMLLAAISRASSAATASFANRLNLVAAWAIGSALAGGTLLTRKLTLLVANLKFYVRATKRGRSAADVGAERTVAAEKRNRTVSI